MPLSFEHFRHVFSMLEPEQVRLGFDFVTRDVSSNISHIGIWAMDFGAFMPSTCLSDPS